MIELMRLDEDEFERRFRGTALERTKRVGLLRNVAVALGNWGAPEAVPVLTSALGDSEPLVRAHAVWALGRIGSAPAITAVEQHAARDPHPWVVEEIGQVPRS